MNDAPKKLNRYSALLREIFVIRYKTGEKKVEFERTDLEKAARKLKIKLPKNLGDVIYSFRYRASLPADIAATQPKGMEWIIEGSGRARYSFRLIKISRIAPNEALVKIKIPDSTPEIIAAHALSDEQALLAKVRYNRLIDIFLGIATYSLQNHLRTSVQEIGQIEIDEIYVGVDRQGRQYIVPVQAKGGKDQLSVVQAKQDLTYCKIAFPNLICRAISAQFMANNLIALFELSVEKDEIKVVEEKHYQLVGKEEITADDLRKYAIRP
jgi:hypothetical protein